MKITKKESDKKYRQKIKVVRDQFYKKVGESCFICDSNKTLCCHRKDCEPHRRIANSTLRQIQRENPKDFVRLCFRCHYGVHWVTKYLNLSWDEIEEYYK